MSTTTTSASFAEPLTPENLHLLNAQLRDLPSVNVLTLLRHYPPLKDGTPILERIPGIFVTRMSFCNDGEGGATYTIETNQDPIIIPIGFHCQDPQDATLPKADAWVQDDLGLIMFSYETSAGRSYVTLMQ